MLLPVTTVPWDRRHDVPVPGYAFFGEAHDPLSPADDHRDVPRTTRDEHDTASIQAPDDLANTVVGGALWKAVSYAVQEGTRIVVVVVLARLLEPSEYGAAALALVAASFLLLFTDPALGAALIQRPTIDEDDRSTVFWIAAGIGLGLTLLGVAFAGVIASLLGDSGVRDLFAVASVCLVLISLTVVPRALLWRQFAYRSLELRDMAATVVGGATAIGIALAGFGAWAIIVNWLVYCVMSLILVYALAGWRPQLRFSRESARILGSFGAKVSGTVVLNWMTLNLDKVLIGRVKGTAALGAYSLAYNVMFLPMTRIALPLGAVLLPAYSRLQDERERLELGWLRSKRIAVLLLMPCFATTFVVAPDLIPTVFGSEWDDAILPLQLLSIAGLAQAIGTFDHLLLDSTGAAGTSLRLTLVMSVASWIAFAVGVHWGIVGVAAGYAVARSSLALPLLWRTTAAVGFDFRSALYAVAPPAVLAIGSALLALAVRHWLLLDLPTAARLVLTGMLTVGVYALLAVAFLRPTVLDLVRTVARRVRRTAD